MNKMNVTISSRELSEQDMDSEPEPEEVTDMLLLVDVQTETSAKRNTYPSDTQISQWANNAYDNANNDNANNDKQSAEGKLTPAEVCIRIVDQTEMVELNSTYRNKNKPTNVLSFPFEMDDNLVDCLEIDIQLLGDIVICLPVIEQEAQEQNKQSANHFAHMITHGVLHLCGYDHQQDKQAEEMEKLEVSLLSQIGIDNPYS